MKAKDKQESLNESPLDQDFDRISLRDYFAAKAMQSLVSENVSPYDDCEVDLIGYSAKYKLEIQRENQEAKEEDQRFLKALAKRAYQISDAMRKQRLTTFE